ncbi:unnamed protein product [Calypogeia fissa]
MEFEEPPVYWVMGSKTECKTKVADAMARGLGASLVETSRAGVRVFAKASNLTYPVLVDTVPFQSTYFEDSDRSKFARKWISVNSLRRLFGRRVVLVGVVNSTIPADYIYEGFDQRQFPFPLVSWLPLLAYIFKEYKEAKILLVNAENTPKLQLKRCEMKDVLLQEGISADNIVLANLSRSGLPVPVSSIGYDFARSTTPFLLREVTRKDTTFGPWGPESVILFGRTGSGKSTLAQMLTLGRLDDPSGTNPFYVSSGIRGATRKVVHGEGRGWYVVDTPGFGEPIHELSTISSDVAQKRLKKYVRIVEGIYSHYLYLVKKDRIDQLEERLWQFFLKLFGENIKYQFTIVVTGADSAWVEENRDYLETCLPGCQSIIGVEFPPIMDDDEECEADQEEMRTKSLKGLEDELASLERNEVFCDMGRFSWVAAKGEAASITSQVVKSLHKKLTNSFRAVAVMAYSEIMLLLSMLTRDDQVVLLPLVDEDENAELLYSYNR